MLRSAGGVPTKQFGLSERDSSRDPAQSGAISPLTCSLPTSWCRQEHPMTASVMSNLAEMLGQQVWNRQ